MAAVETNVLDAHDGYVTKVEHGGQAYELTHKPAQVGDLVRMYQDVCADTTPGGFYEVYGIDSDDGDVMISDDAEHDHYWGASYYDVFAPTAQSSAKVTPSKPRLKVGQLAKVVSAHNFDIGDIVRIVGDDGSNVPYNAERLSDGYTNWGIACRFAPYTPQAGDDLTVADANGAGVDYTLEARRATAGERVIVVERFSTYDNDCSIGEIHVCQLDDYHELGLAISTDKAEVMKHHRYLVLSPKKPAQAFTWISADEGEAEDEEVTHLLAKYKSNTSDHYTETIFEAGGKFPTINGYSVYAIDIAKGAE
jgi:hypothetical protein